MGHRCCAYSSRSAINYAFFVVFLVIALAQVYVQVGEFTNTTSMTSKGVAELLSDLGVGRTHSRPHVSNDNPYSEAVNKTLKYCPAFPARLRWHRRRPSVRRRVLRLVTVCG